jgi:hypothetical protein
VPKYGFEDTDTVIPGHAGMDIGSSSYYSGYESGFGSGDFGEYMDPEDEWEWLDGDNLPEDPELASNGTDFLLLNDTHVSTNTLAGFLQMFGENGGK